LLEVFSGVLLVLLSSLSPFSLHPNIGAEGPLPLPGAFCRSNPCEWGFSRWVSGDLVSSVRMGGFSLRLTPFPVLTGFPLLAFQSPLLFVPSGDPRGLFSFGLGKRSTCVFLIFFSSCIPPPTFFFVDRQDTGMGAPRYFPPLSPGLGVIPASACFLFFFFAVFPV